MRPGADAVKVSDGQTRRRVGRVCGTKAGGGRKCASLKALRENFLIRFPAFCWHLVGGGRPSCAQGGGPCRPFRPSGGNPSSGFCMPPRPVWNGKAARSPGFSGFPHCVKLLCGKKSASLLKEIFFFQQRNSIFAARKAPPFRGNALYEHFSGVFSGVF